MWNIELSWGIVCWGYSKFQFSIELLSSKFAGQDRPRLHVGYSAWGCQTMQKLCHLSNVRTVHGINATSRLSVGWEGFWRRGLAGRRGGCRGESQKEEEKSLIKLLQSAQVMPSACCLPRCLLPAFACQQGARQGWGRWACLAGCVGGWGVVHKISNLSYYILVCSSIFMDFSSFFSILGSARLCTCDTIEKEWRCINICSYQWKING